MTEKKTEIIQTTEFQLRAHIKELEVKSKTYFQASHNYKEVLKGLKKKARFLNIGDTVEVEHSLPDGTKTIFKMAVE